MQYSVRLATLADVDIIADLWREFAEDRAMSDSTLSVAPDFNFNEYVKSYLSKESTSCLILESSEILLFPNLPSVTEQAGFICTYIYTEFNPFDIQPLTPFNPRNLGAVLAFYIKPEHRQIGSMNLLINAALDRAIELQVSDLDLLIPEESEVHNLLNRLGFKKIAAQYTKHLQEPIDKLVPSNSIFDERLPLRNLDTNELIKDAEGNTIYLTPLKDENGKNLKDSQDLLIYAVPVRDPQTSEWAFNRDGTLAICPPLLDEEGKVVEIDGITQFYSPAYQVVDGNIQIKLDLDGNYLFE
jgi:GNAT superfamily N-acetyltransferase